LDTEIAERVLSRPRTEELRHLEPLHLEGARERFGSRISDEELLLRLTMPEEQVDAIGLGPPAPERGPVQVAPGRSPVATLLGEVTERKAIRYLRVQTNDELVEWRRAT